jgi:hypothetical protein
MLWVETDGRALLIEPHRALCTSVTAAALHFKFHAASFRFIVNSERVTFATTSRVRMVSKIAGQSGPVLLPMR